MGEEELRRFVASVPFAAPAARRHVAPKIAVPEVLEPPRRARQSTQEGFGRLLHEIAKQGGELAERIVTTSPDVTVSTNLGAWVNQRGLFDRRERADVFRDQQVASAQRWAMSPQGQHLELGIAENNLFLLLASLGLAGSLFGTRLLPIGTLYDPFISRGLDALNYACYQDARFLLVATPSGISLAPEGGAHQSVLTPLIGMGQPGLTSFEPAYVDELAEILRFALEHMQAEDGGSVYLRLSTRPLAQPQRDMSAALRDDVVRGGYWLVPPAPDAELALVCCGVVTEEALAAHGQIREDVPGAGLLVVTSPDRLHREWRAERSACPCGPSAGVSLARRPARDGRRRASGHALLARRRRASPNGVARGRALRPDRRRARALPGVRPRCRRHGGRRRTRPAGRRSDSDEPRDPSAGALRLHDRGRIWSRGRSAWETAWRRER